MTFQFKPAPKGSGWTQRGHKLLHQRINAMSACGNPDWRKCPYCKQYDNPLNMRGEKCGRFVHTLCSAKAKREARRNKDVHSIQKSH